MVLRAAKKRSRDVSLYDPIGTDKEGNEIHLLDIIITDEQEVADTIAVRADIEKLRRVLKRLPPREFKVICLRYGLNGGREYTQREVASILNISRSYISRIEKGAIRQLREAMEQPGD